ncbi:hypothetical protein MUK42_33121 [Musa troglodytarum]|uniref:Uncharacterized protein n=1 Tax=Musa troglodytarum TaxID=320322 RepID=A0A9E7JT18_9LILI|nr:hypothetical protein MUK42_33121 [Musa troglodytarum]
MLHGLAVSFCSTSPSVVFLFHQCGGERVRGRDRNLG